MPPDSRRLSVSPARQSFLLAVHAQGATYEQRVDGTDPTQAMSRALRRKWIAELALAEAPMTFVLTDWDFDD